MSEDNCFHAEGGIMDPVRKEEVAHEVESREDHPEGEFTLRAIHPGEDAEDLHSSDLSDDLPLLPEEESTPKGVHVQNMGSRVLDRLAEVNKELWLVLSLLAIAALMNYLITGHRMLLGLYTLPTLFSAYFYGRRHATLTAFASVFLVGLLAHFNTKLFSNTVDLQFVQGRWYDITAWAGILIVTAYAMGTLHENSRARLEELRNTYHGLLHILRQFVSKDKYTENHSYRVSIYATKIAAYLRLNPERIEDVRAASLLHDIGKLDTSRQLLYKAARLSQDEFVEMKRHVEKSTSMLEPAGGALRRIIPIILAHHDKFDGSGYHANAAEDIPLEARIIAVSDVYDSLTSDRPYRKAMSPYEAKAIISKGSGAEFDPRVVKAFLAAFSKGELEIPEVVL